MPAKAGIQCCSTFTDFAAQTEINSGNRFFTLLYVCEDCFPLDKKRNKGRRKNNGEGFTGRISGRFFLNTTAYGQRHLCHLI